LSLAGGYSTIFEEFTRFFEVSYKRGRIGIRFQTILNKNIA